MCSQASGADAPGQEHGVRVGQRGGQRIEDIGVEEVTGIARDLVPHPRHAPHRKERIATVGKRKEISNLLMEYRDRDEDQSQRHRNSLSHSGEP
jgi:hypothetical protein